MDKPCPRFRWLGVAAVSQFLEERRQPAFRVSVVPVAFLRRLLLVEDAGALQAVHEQLTAIVGLFFQAGNRRSQAKVFIAGPTAGGQPEEGSLGVDGSEGVAGRFAL
jgi:hypothetical protein